MEKQIFTYNGWDEQEIGRMIFYSPRLIVGLPGYPMGTSFGSAYVDYQEGLMEFYDSEGTPIVKFKLALSALPFTE